MSSDYFLKFHRDEDGSLLLPRECSVSASCCVSKELQQAMVTTIEQSLYALAVCGMDLRSLDGVTVALDARKAACELQELPDRVIPLEMTDQLDTMELARTVAVKRGDEYRFHIVLGAGPGNDRTFIRTGSAGANMRLFLARSRSCGTRRTPAQNISGNLQLRARVWRPIKTNLPQSTRCLERIRSLSVVSAHRPEAKKDFDRIFCGTFEESRTSSEKWIAGCRDAGGAIETFREIKQAFGDAFISAGYLIGHLHEIEANGFKGAPEARQMLSGNAAISEPLERLARRLHELC